jgi:hypothetical protein
MISPEALLSIGVFGLAITSSLLVLLDDRRLLVVTLAVQYTLTAAIQSVTLNMQIAGSKWLAGIAACLIFMLYLRNSDRLEMALERAIPFNRFFRTIAVLLILLVAVGISTVNLINLEGMDPGIGLGTAILVCLSFLHLGLCEEPMRVGIGLLTLLSGFEITYSFLEPSLTVVGLLAVVHIGIALVTGYLMMQETGLEEAR